MKEVLGEFSQNIDSVYLLLFFIIYLFFSLFKKASSFSFAFTNDFFHNIHSIALPFFLKKGVFFGSEAFQTSFLFCEINFCKLVFRFILSGSCVLGTFHLGVIFLDFCNPIIIQIIPWIPQKLVVYSDHNHSFKATKKLLFANKPCFYINNVLFRSRKNLK